MRKRAVWTAWSFLVDAGKKETERRNAAGAGGSRSPDVCSSPEPINLFVNYLYLGLTLRLISDVCLIFWVKRK